MPDPQVAARTSTERPGLILLHGVGGSAVGFSPLVAEFERLGWPAVAWSQPGYDGTPLVEPYDLRNCARALASWLVERRAGEVVLVGHSMGGMLAQTLSAQEEALTAFRIAGLVLAHTSPAFGNAGGDFQRQFIASRTRPLDEGKTMHEIAATLVPRMTAPGASVEARETAIAMMAGVPAQTYRLAVAAVAAFEGRQHLAHISVPTLCLAAEHDATSAPAVLQRMAERIPGADYHCMEDLGHLAPIEDPRRWAAAVADWCNGRLGQFGRFGRLGRLGDEVGSMSEASNDRGSDR